MANITISKRERKNGISYTARVRLKQNRVVVFSKSKSFTTKMAAQKWAKETAHKVENNLQNETYELIDITLGDLIVKYIHTKQNSSKPLGRSAHYALKQISGYKLANVLASRVTSSDIIDFCLERKKTASAQTIAVDISCLRKVLRIAKSMFQVNVSDAPIIQAYPALHDLNLIARSKRRDRRVSSDEHTALMNEFQRMSYHHCNHIPFADLFKMSLLTCCRVGELCALRWADLNEIDRYILVRDRKNPNGSNGNNSLLPLLGDSLSIILKQPRCEERIFPYNPRSVTAGFRRARKRLNIEGLRYHDLRREGASRLIEAGLSVEEAARVTGHKDLNILWNVYVSITPEHVFKRFQALKNLPD